MVTITHFKFIANSNKRAIKICAGNGRVDSLPDPWKFFPKFRHSVYELKDIFFLNKVCPTSFVIASQFPNPLEEESFVFYRYIPNTQTAPIFFFCYCIPSKLMNFPVINTPTPQNLRLHGCDLMSHRLWNAKDGHVIERNGRDYTFDQNCSPRHW